MSNCDDDWRPAMQMSPHATYRHRVAAHELTDRITATSDVFVLAHFGVARIKPDAWRLQVTGMVSRPAAMSLHQIRELPKVELEAFIKCAGFPHEHTIATRNVSNAVWGASVDILKSRETCAQGASFHWAFARITGAMRISLPTATSRTFRSLAGWPTMCCLPMNSMASRLHPSTAFRFDCWCQATTARTP